MHAPWPKILDATTLKVYIAVNRGKLGPIHSNRAVVGGVTVDSIKLKGGSISC